MTTFLQSLLEKMPVRTGDEDAEFAQQQLDKIANMSDDEVHNQLDKAAEMDEVDTVVFGLETDKGDIVKVYVNAEQADAFEEALATELAETDDIDEVLAELDKEFDIIDVEWPEGYDDEDEEDEEEEDGSDEDAEDENLTDGSESLNKDIDRSDTNESYSAKLGLKNKFLGESEESIKAHGLNKTQALIYRALKFLGAPDELIDDTTFATALKKDTRDVAEKLESTGRVNDLRVFVRRIGNSDDATEESPTKSLAFEEKHESKGGLPFHVANKHERILLKMIKFLGVSDKALVKHKSAVKKSLEETRDKLQHDGEWHRVMIFTKAFDPAIAQVSEAKDDVAYDSPFTDIDVPKFGSVDDEIGKSVSAMDPDSKRLERYIASNRYRKLGVDAVTKLGITPTMLVHYQSLVRIIGERVKEMDERQRYYLLKFLGHDSFSDYAINECQGEIELTDDSVTIKADGIELHFSNAEVQQIRTAIETGESVDLDVEGSSKCTVTPEGEGVVLRDHTTDWSVTLDSELVKQLLDSDGKMPEDEEEK